MNRFSAKWLLIPVAKLYELAIEVRNWLFDNHLLRSVRPDVYTISVGNLTVGGTGKTPMIELLIKRYALYNDNPIGQTATLSRGYGRLTKGFRIAAPDDTAQTIGDEPLQLYRKFGSGVRVCVGERRARSIAALLTRHPETKRVLLDDAFQHRAVQPHLNLLLTDYNRPFYDDYPFPAGWLREGRQGAIRADGIVVTKCPLNLFSTEQQRITAHIRRYARPGIPVFFAGLQYSSPVSFATGLDEPALKNVVLVTGLANASLLEQYVRQTFILHRHYRFADHYDYTRADLEKIVAELPENTVLLTTEKDWVKLDALLTTTERATWPLFYLPIAVQFLSGQELAFEHFLDENRLKYR